MKQLKISKELSLPLDIVTQTVAILAKRRVGKSYTMRGIAEQLLDVGQQVILVDPKGDQWGIRSSADGKKPGYSVLILGGEHGDLPLEVNGGELVARLAVEERVSMLLDLSTFRKHEVATFMAIFLENLYRLKAQEKYRTPVMLIVDEADAIAPQKPQKGEERMLGAIEDIVRRGGQRGLGCIVVTQRSAVLNKNVLTQSQMLIVLRTIAPQDISAMKAWIEVHGTLEEGKTLIDSLPSLPIGDAWFWSPGWPTAEGIFKLVHVLPIKTFDSAATPKPGERKVTPKNLADVDLDALKKQMAETIEKAKSNDPVVLKKKITELETKLKQKKSDIVMVQPHVTKTIEIPVFKDSQIKKLEKIFGKMYTEAEKHGKAMSLFWGEFNQIGDALVKAFDVIKLNQKRTIIPAYNPDKFKAKPPEKIAKAIVTEGGLNSGETIILKAIAQFQEGMTTEHIAVLTGYKKTSRIVYLQKLSAKGYVQKSGQLYFATSEGIEALGDNYEPLPTGDSLREHILRTIPEGEKKVLEVILTAYPDAVSGEHIEEQTGYKKTSRIVYVQKLVARKVVEKNGTLIRASDKLYD